MATHTSQPGDDDNVVPLHRQSSVEPARLVEQEPTSGAQAPRLMEPEHRHSTSTPAD